MMKHFLLPLLVFVTYPLHAFEESYNRSMDHIAKTKIDYSTYDPEIQVETELLQYDADHGANRKGLDYLRSNFMWTIDDDSRMDFELQSFRDENQLDARTINSIIRQRNLLLEHGGIRVSLQGQLTTPVNTAVFNQEGVKPGIGMPIEYFLFERFSTGVTPTLEFSRGPEQQEWGKKLIVDWFLNYQFTHKLGASLSLYAEKPEEVDTFSYSELSLSIGYQINDALRLNVGTWIGGEPDFFVYNSLLAASYAF